MEPAAGTRHFRVRVFSESAGINEIERWSLSADQLRSELESQGFTCLQIQPLKGASPRTQFKNFPLLIFCQQLLSLLEAGLQLVEAVDTLTEKEQDEQHRALLLQLQSSLRAGLPFSQALAQHPNVFPALFQAAIEASEQTGAVVQALQRFVVYETQYQQLRSRLTGALIYPALLFSVGALVVAFLLAYVVPRFSVVFVDRLDEMPYLSSLVVRLGLAISENTVASLMTLAAATVTVVLLMLQPAVRAWLMVQCNKIPWLGDKMHSYQLVRIYRSLGMLLRGGIPAVRALEMVVPLAPLGAKHRILQVIQSVSEGQPLSVALHQQGFTSVVSERLLAVGERSGQMGEMMDRAADFMDAELARTVDQAVRLLEPLMMVVIGILIGGIVMLMYLPIFELAESVQ